jgi:hypothetical protein
MILSECNEEFGAPEGKAEAVNAAVEQPQSTVAEQKKPEPQALEPEPPEAEPELREPQDDPPESWWSRFGSWIGWGR